MSTNGTLQSRGSQQQKIARESLVRLFKESPLPVEQQLTNLGLYMRSTILAKVLYLNELYSRILMRPGIIMEFGVWWGQNLALFESFRGVLEPFNCMRKVVGDAHADFAGLDIALGLARMDLGDANGPALVVAAVERSHLATPQPNMLWAWAECARAETEQRSGHASAAAASSW